MASSMTSSSDSWSPFSPSSSSSGPPLLAPVFVLPEKLDFYVSDRSTHKRIFTIYNPYDVDVKYKGEAIYYRIIHREAEFFVTCSWTKYVIWPISVKICNKIFKICDSLNKKIAIICRKNVKLNFYCVFITYIFLSKMAEICKKKTNIFLCFYIYFCPQIINFLMESSF
jgi:hypothetical protein